MTCDMTKPDDLAEQIFARFMQRSGFAGAWWWWIGKKPAAVRAAALLERLGAARDKKGPDSEGQNTV